MPAHTHTHSGREEERRVHDHRQSVLGVVGWTPKKKAKGWRLVQSLFLLESELRQLFYLLIAVGRGG